jgi:hypothetical protein
LTFAKPSLQFSLVKPPPILLLEFTSFYTLAPSPFRLPFPSSSSSFPLTHNLQYLHHGYSPSHLSPLSPPPNIYLIHNYLHSLTLPPPPFLLRHFNLSLLHSLFFSSSSSSFSSSPFPPLTSPSLLLLLFHLKSAPDG